MNSWPFFCKIFDHDRLLGFVKTALKLSRIDPLNGGNSLQLHDLVCLHKGNFRKQTDNPAL
jgi:hypothetical protein